MEVKEDIFYIKEVLGGNSFAFKYLVERYKDRSFNLALRICGNREDAEEATQDAFLRSFRSLNDFRMESRYSTWLFRIVYNCAITSVRTRKSNILSLEDFPASYLDFKEAGCSEQEADREYTNALINFALQKLPEVDRGLIALHYFEEQSIKDIAKTTGLSKPNIKVRLFRARTRMLEIMQKAEKNKVEYHEEVR
jgi:RNA polymerase sigma factor (sigma-70 family)